MLDSLPALAQRVTVFGSTLNRAATSAGVSRVSGWDAWVSRFMHATSLFDVKRESYPYDHRRAAEMDRL
jgi:hypothetical protein